MRVPFYASISSGLQGVHWSNIDRSRQRPRERQKKKENSKKSVSGVEPSAAVIKEFPVPERQPFQPFHQIRLELWVVRIGLTSMDSGNHHHLGQIRELDYSDLSFISAIVHMPEESHNTTSVLRNTLSLSTSEPMIRGNYATTTQSSETRH